jgi:hypothetical protein
MRRRYGSPLRTRQHGQHDVPDHGEQVVAVAPLRTGDAPQVELLRRTGVLPVDAVAAVADARTDQQHVVVIRLGGQFA